jgi:hypothetical protein
MREDALERLRMADGQADVAAFDACSQECTRRGVRDRYDVAVDYKRRLVQRLYDCAVA